jgi:dedicator of cytokinesis protein 3
MLTIHEGTLEKFFRKNFSEEIRRLAVGNGIGDGRSNATPLPMSVGSPVASKPSLYERSANQSLASVSTSRPTQSGPLQLSGPTTTPRPPSPPSGFLSARIGMMESPNEGQSPAQTPLQRHLAHLVRHGFNGVSSRPDNDSHLSQSPPSSHANLPGTAPGSASIASVTGSGSIKTRFSNKFGSLNFGRG